MYVVHIAVTIMIEALIDGISRGNNTGGMMRGFNPLQFVFNIKKQRKYQLGCNHGLGRGGEGAWQL